MDSDRSWPMGRDGAGRFLPGGPGRLVGARGLMSMRVGRLLLRVDHEDVLLPKLRQWFLPQYLQLIGRMLPREVDELGSEVAAEGIADEAPAGLKALAQAVLAELDDGGEEDAWVASDADPEAAGTTTQDVG